jgi:hypothetical protein
MEQQLPIMYGATPQYLAMMGVMVREGRPFTPPDDARAPLVVLVNETMARTIWPGESAIGKCVRSGHGSTLMDPASEDMDAVHATLPCRTVVGIVRDSRARSLRLERGEDRLMQYYVPFEQLPAPPVPDYSAVHGFLVQTAGEPDELAIAVQRAIQGTSVTPVFARVRAYQELIDPQLRSWRLGATLFSLFGAIAVGVAGAGLFAVVSYLVAQRTREIGVRIALGASRHAIAGLVVRDALRMVIVGSGIGVLVSLAAAPLVQPMLFQISAREPLTVGFAVVLLGTVALLAAAIPARRASEVSPLLALRGD